MATRLSRSAMPRKISCDDTTTTLLHFTKMNEDVQNFLMLFIHKMAKNMVKKNESHKEYITKINDTGETGEAGEADEADEADEDGSGDEGLDKNDNDEDDNVPTAD